MPVDLTNCDREPIHIIGRIQSFGYLLAVSPEWIVTFASANLGEVVGEPVEALIGRRARDILTEDAIHTLRSHLQMLTTPLSVERIFGMELFEAAAGPQLFDVALHRSGRNIVIEAEPSDTAMLAKFMSYVRPMTERVKQAGATLAMCDMAAKQMRALTGFDRVMVYRFAGDESGEVVAESRASGIDSFMGMHFPASDIPRQARELYTKNLLRLISDVGDPTVPILPNCDPENQPIDLTPIDLTMSTLRAVSPIHIEYLGNMDVQASMSASIVRDGKLWGLFACHHYQPLKVNYPVRTAAELFAELFAYLLDQAERNHSQELAARSARVHDALMARLADGGSLIDNFDDFAASIAQIIPYDGIAAWIEGQFVSHGDVPDPDDFIALTRFLDTAGNTHVWATDCLAAAFPPAAAFRERCAGLLALPVSRQARDFIVLFRREVPKNLPWAGNPEKFTEFGPNGARLTPRKSFELWNQAVDGHSREWSRDEQSCAENLRVTLLEVVLRLSDAAAQERERAARHSEFLIAELNHRVRNMLNLVRSLVSQSQTSAASIAEFARNIGDRIESLARAHDQLTHAHQAPVSLHRLITTEAEAYTTPGEHSLELSGPDFHIVPHAVTTMTLVLHELMTNARKYGALSRPGGTISIGTTSEDDGGLALRWEERGGPPVAAPTRRGFGSTILERSVPHELGGTARVEFCPGGIVAHFALPAKHLADGAKDLAEGARRPLDGVTSPGEGKIGTAPHSPATDPVRAGVAAPWPPFTALVVEDNMLIAMDAEEVLRELGAVDVRLSASVLGALDTIAGAAFDVALLDVNLGDETSESIALALRGRGTPFIMTTGFGDYVSDISAYAGAPVLTKPYTAAVLSRALAQVMAGLADRLR